MAANGQAAAGAPPAVMSTESEEWTEERIEAALKLLKSLHIQVGPEPRCPYVVEVANVLSTQLRNLRTTIPRMIEPMTTQLSSRSWKCPDLPKIVADQKQPRRSFRASMSRQRRRTRRSGISNRSCRKRKPRRCSNEQSRAERKNHKVLSLGELETTRTGSLWTQLDEPKFATRFETKVLPAFPPEKSALIIANDHSSKVDRRASLGSC